MPRNGHGSSDSGPIDGHEILHGTSGDKILQHTKHVAPMPTLEKGEALPGMNASGGAAAPLNDASEEFGTNAPRNEQFGHDETLIAESGNTASNTKSGASASTAASRGSQQPSNGGKSSHNTHGVHNEQDKHDLESIGREKAERYVNLNEEDVQHAGTADKSSDRSQRSSQRAPKDVGRKEDIEQLHGKATSSDHNKGQKKGSENARGSGRSGQTDGHNDSQTSGKQSGGEQSGGKGDSELGGDSSLESMRHTAEKFVNLDD